jgi:carbon-monoxide dehydrogenase medium subunit
MYPAPFEYFAPTTMKDALSLLKQHGTSAKLLAGGHSLIPMMKLRLLTPEVIIDLGRVRELTGIREDRGHLLIGAMTTHQTIESSPAVRSHAPLLAEVAPCIGDVQVRNRGTIGGSIAHADPAADWPAPLLALEAEFVAAADGATRTIRARDFFIDMLTTALKPGEILTEIRVPFQSKDGHAYEKVRQPASGFALVGIAVQLELDGATCRDARIGVTGVGSRPVRAERSEAALKGRSLDEQRIREAADHVTDGLDVLDDLHASTEFRAELARVHTRRALQRASESNGPAGPAGH